MPYKTFKDLSVWQEARDLAIEIYCITNQGKFGKDYGLRDQIRRSCVSISSNIAEGCDRATPKEFSRFLDIARGSTAELRTQLDIASGIGYIDKNQFTVLDNSCCKISTMIINLKKSINNV
jgi:four helix bundle protein